MRLVGATTPKVPSSPVYQASSEMEEARTNDDFSNALKLTTSNADRRYSSEKFTSAISIKTFHVEGEGSLLVRNSSVLKLSETAVLYQQLYLGWKDVSH